MSKPNGYRPMASGAARAELLAAAEGLKALTRKKPTQSEGKAAVSRLLAAAVAWRESAQLRAQEAGLPPRARPIFRDPPALPPRDAPPPQVVYKGNLQWWASRYAWDLADGLPTEESARALVQMAIVGPKKEPEMVTRRFLYTQRGWDRGVARAFLPAPEGLRRGEEAWHMATIKILEERPDVAARLRVLNPPQAPEVEA